MLPRSEGRRFRWQEHRAALAGGPSHSKAGSSACVPTAVRPPADGSWLHVGLSCPLDEHILFLVFFFSIQLSLTLSKCNENCVIWYVTMFTRATRATKFIAAGKEDRPSSRRVLEFPGIACSCRAATLGIKLRRDSDPCRHWHPRVQMSRGLLVHRLRGDETALCGKGPSLEQATAHMQQQTRLTPSVPGPSFPF